ncbi:MAG TPA: hypothetical protein VIY66_11615 [Candidatus Acidoferrales bacterium]
MPHRAPATQSRNANPRASQSDFLVEGGGTVYLLRPLSDAGRAWIEEYIGQGNGYQPYWPTVVVEAPYIADIVRGIQRDGLAVR